MSRVLRVEPEALAELQEAASFYHRKQPGLGFEFLDAVEPTVNRVRELPESFPIIMERPTVRRALLQRFPYAVVFMVRGDAIHIVAYAHAKRRPLYWAHRALDVDE